MLKGKALQLLTVKLKTTLKTTLKTNRNEYKQIETNRSRLILLIKVVYHYRPAAILRRGFCLTGNICWQFLVLFSVLRRVFAQKPALKYFFFIGLTFFAICVTLMCVR